MCFFGDHVPIMPQLYQALDSSEKRTDFFIWTNRSCSGNPISLNLRQVEELPALLLQLVGTTSMVH